MKMKAECIIYDPLIVYCHQHANRSPALRNYQLYISILVM